MALHFSQCRRHDKLYALHVYFSQNFINITNCMFLLFYVFSHNYIYITNCILKRLDLQFIFVQFLYILNVLIGLKRLYISSLSLVTVLSTL